MCDLGFKSVPSLVTDCSTLSIRWARAAFESLISWSINITASLFDGAEVPGCCKCLQYLQCSSHQAFLGRIRQDLTVSLSF